jgi:hypothetical protein
MGMRVEVRSIRLMKRGGKQVAGVYLQFRRGLTLPQDVPILRVRRPQILCQVSNHRHHRLCARLNIHVDRLLELSQARPQANVVVRWMWCPAPIRQQQLAAENLLVTRSTACEVEA